MSDLRIVGLDLSLNHTGIAYPGGSTTVLESTGLRGVARHAKVRSLVLDQVRGADVVVSEAPFVHLRNLSTAADLIGLHAVVYATLWTNRIAVAHVAPTTLKEYATGSGRAEKPEMHDALALRLGALCPTDDNEVDAFWLRAAGLEHYGSSAFGRQLRMPLEQVRALDKAIWPDLEDVLANAI